MAGRRAVIGAGVVGAALADELSARGWTDITVVDQSDLPATGGSSSHAPGLVFQAANSKALTEMARNTVERFVALHHEGQSCFLQVADSRSRRRPSGSPSCIAAMAGSPPGASRRPVFADGRAVGYVTSAADGYTIGKGIAYAWVPAEPAVPGQEAEIGYFDRRVRAVITSEPLLDPEMTRLRG